MTARRPRLTVVICTHNPSPVLRDETLVALRAQTLPAPDWELLLIDNASVPALDPALVAWHPQGRVIREPELGLTPARLRGFRESQADLIVMLDDDNAAAPDYLANALRLEESQPEVGAWGGRILPRFAQAPEPWMEEYLSMLALRDLGDQPVLIPARRPGEPFKFPVAAPVGAGMIIRKAAFATYAALLASSSTARRALDRRGQSLSSGGDNDLVLTLLAQGWAAAYAPDLRLTHHIPAGRTQPRYLGRLRRGIFRCWTTVCALHALSAPPKLPPWRSRLMIMREWIRHRAWRGGRSWVEWMGVAGKLEGQTDLYHLEAAIVAPASSR